MFTLAQDCREFHCVSARKALRRGSMVWECEALHIRTDRSRDGQAQGPGDSFARPISVDPFLLARPHFQEHPQLSKELFQLLNNI